MSIEILKMSNNRQGYDIVTTCVNREQARNWIDRLKKEEPTSDDVLLFIADIEMA